MDTHIAEETRVYDCGDERFMTSEQKRAFEAERKLKDKFAHMKLRKYLPGHIACVDTLKES